MADNDLERIEVWRSFYQDSIVLMQLTGYIQHLPDIQSATVLMGTPSNLALLAEMGFQPQEVEAGPNDLVIAVRGNSAESVEKAFKAARQFFEEKQTTSANEGYRPRTISGALASMPDASLAAISIPGQYAKREAMAALAAGLSVFLFSDNVSLEEELELKTYARDHNLLCMGPDCGTAFIDGVGLGFANVIPAGNIACIASSGTGLQALAVQVAQLGEGISQGIGVGGRDLTDKIGAIMTLAALKLLNSDPASSVIVLLSKGLDESVVAKLEAALKETSKPVVGCFFNRTSPIQGLTAQCTTIEEASRAAVALLRHREWEAQPFDSSRELHFLYEGINAANPHRGSKLLGLFVGGTLSLEALVMLRGLLGQVGSNIDGTIDQAEHIIVDVGAETFRKGRPHPMLDPDLRSDLVLQAGNDPQIGVLLLDLVLGRGTHPDPAQSLAAAARRAKETAGADGRDLVIIASIVGMPEDPQPVNRQKAELEASGVVVLSSSAQAARLAADLVRSSISSHKMES